MKKLLPAIITILVVGLLSFYGGLKLGESKSLQANILQGGNFGQNGPQMMQQNGSNTATGQQRRNVQQGNMVNGEILSGDDKSITVKLPDGGSKIVFFSGTTKIVKSTDTQATDLTTGTTVMINGTTNTDGSISATNIQIRPAMPEQQPIIPSQKPVQTTQGT